MKKHILSGILGLVLTTATTAHGQGAIIIGNEQPPFNQVLVPQASLPGSRPVTSADGAVLDLWYGEGVLSANQLAQGPSLLIGDPGFYNDTVVLLPGWTPGETWTFQIRGTLGPLIGTSILWTESTDIGGVGGPGQSHNSIGLTFVPEPSAFAIGSLAAAGLAFFRRRS
jgi:hypothetical protein